MVRIGDREEIDYLKGLPDELMELFKAGHSPAAIQEHWRLAKEAYMAELGDASLAAERLEATRLYANVLLRLAGAGQPLP